MEVLGMTSRDKSTRIVKKLKQTEERYRELFDSINVCVAVYKAKLDGEDFVIKDFNTAAENVERVSRRDVIGKSIIEAFPGVKDYGIFEVMQRVWKTGVPERFPARFYKDERISGWRDNYVYKLPSGDIVAVYEDITEHVKAEQTIKEAEQRYRTVADFTYNWEVWRSPEGKIIYVSPSCERISGYTPAQFLKDRRLMDKIIAPEDRHLKAGHDKKVSLGITDECIFRIRRKDGEIRWIEHVCRPVIDENGKHLGTRGSNCDITTRKMAEAALDQLNREQASIANFLPDATFAVDKDMKVVLWNHAMEKMTGIPAFEMVGKQDHSHSIAFYGEIRPCLMDLIWEDSQTIRSMYPQITNEGSSLLAAENFCPALNQGKGAWLFAKAAPLYDREGNIVGAIESVRDITDSKAAGEALRASETMYRLLADNADDVIWTLDTDLHYTYISPSIRKLRGFEPEEAMRQRAKESMTPESFQLLLHELKTLRLATTGHLNKSVRLEIEHYRKDRTKVWGEVLIRTLYDNMGQHTGFIGISRDITERRKLEAELRNREAMFRTVFEDQYQYTGLLDPGGHVLAVNKSALQVIGATQEDVTGKYFQETAWWRHSGEAKQQLQGAIGEVTQGKIVNFNTTHVNIGGEIRTIDFTLNPIHDDKGRVIYMVAEGRDITDATKAQLSMKKSEARYRHLLESSSEAIFIVQDSQFKFVNYAAMKLTGYTLDVLMSMNIFDLFYAADVETARHNYSRRLAGEEPIQRLEYRIVTSTGQVKHASFTAVMTEWEDNKALMYFIQDISENRLVAEALKLSEERFHAFFEYSTNYCYMISPEGNILDLNRSALDVLGYSAKEEIIGKPALSTVYAPRSREKWTKLFERWRETGTLQNEEFSIISKNGEERDVMLSASAMHDSAANLLHSISIQTDITEHKRLLAEQTRLDKLESVGALAAGIAHDFNNILGAILGNISLARAEIPAANEVNTWLQDAEKAALRAKDLTRQLLTFSRGGAPIKKNLYLNKMIQETAHFAVHGSAVKCEFSIPDNLWPAEIDEGQISQVISNLVINARQAMPNGGVIKIKAENMELFKGQSLAKSLPLPSGKYVRIAIEDQGTGIPDEHLHRIFDPYFTTKQDGNGLGLATSFSIVRNHVGHISVESVLGHGTTFFVYLPASMEAARTNDSQEGADQHTFRGRVLIMDDEAALRKMIDNMLRRMGFEYVAAAGTGDEAIRLYSQARTSGAPFDLVIMDLTIPGGMGGKETMEKLFKIDPGITALISSGYAAEPVMSDYEKYGFKGIITKPYTYDDLRKALRMVIKSPGE
jgi:PAS domain S-box-containing protein